MKQYNLGEMEQRFADLIWQQEPLHAHFNRSVRGHLLGKELRPILCSNAFVSAEDFK